ncbi:DUF1102 domain-containing protein [Halalkalirubrum salinum]|uniref:DUF1102 domain-containing protein n=1 Tax=Halalkalirubrum salinum TaxID=2563889 RepID=UPI0010FAF932|nr:DUF1102 domain-containing protein [Halalkalirubrum salinum]
MSSRVRTVLLVVALVSGLSLAVSTGAVPVEPGDLLSFDEDQDPAGDVRLYPATDDGNYSFVDPETGELYVDISSSNPDTNGEGVSANGVTYIETVFYVNYQSDESGAAEVWITHDGDTEAVQFTSADSVIMEQDSNITIAAGENVSIGLRIDTRNVDGSEPLIENMNIHAKVPEDSTADTDSDSGGLSAFTSNDDTEDEEQDDVEDEEQDDVEDEEQDDVEDEEQDDVEDEEQGDGSEGSEQNETESTDPSTDDDGESGGGSDTSEGDDSDDSDEQQTVEEAGGFGLSEGFGLTFSLGLAGLLLLLVTRVSRGSMGISRKP